MALTRSSPTEAKHQADAVHASHLAGLRAVAGLEISKGVLALAGALALLKLRHKDIGDVVGNIVYALHLNPSRRIVAMAIAAAGRVNEKRIVALIYVAVGYAMIRAIEAYGLWNARAWAEWFAIVSGGAYLPWEIVEVAKRPDHIVRWAVLAINILVVAYMIYVRWDAIKQGTRRKSANG